MYDTVVKTSVIQKYSTLLYILAVFFVLGKAVLFFYQNPNFIMYWDWPGHIQKAQQLSWIPWEGGWDTTFWGGYPTQRYPALYHYILKAAVATINSQKSAAVLVTLASIVFLSIGIHRAVARRTDGATSTGALVAKLTVLLAFLYAPGTLLGSFRGTLFAGGGPALLATVWLLFLLAARRWTSQAMWFGLLLLTHPITASVGALYLVSTLIFGTLKKQPSETSKHALLALLVGSLVGLPWILVMLDPSFATGAINLSGDPQVAYLIAAVIVLLTAAESKRLSDPFVPTILALVLLANLTDTMVQSLQKLGAHGIHFYRYAWYFLVLSPLGIVGWLRIRHRFRPVTVVLASLGIVLIFLISPQPSLPLTAAWDRASLPAISGRIMDVSRYSTMYQTPHFAEHWLVTATGTTGTTGVFYESSPYGLIYYGLKNAIDPASRKSGTNEAYFNTLLGKQKLPLDIRTTADLLGINYVSFTSPSPAPDRPNLYQFGQLAMKQGQQNLSTYYLLEQVSSAPLVEPLNTLPTIDPDVELGEWWTQTDRSSLRVRADELPVTEDLNLEAQPAERIVVQPQSIQFTLLSPKPVPVFLKFTYSPYWEAAAAGGTTTQPLWVTPGYMLIFANGDITLSWNPPLYLRLFTPLSLLTLLALIIASIFPPRNINPS